MARSEPSLSAPMPSTASSLPALRAEIHKVRGGQSTLIPMVIGLAFLATAIATLFAQATLVRYTKDHRPQDRAWTISLALFALASAALATGTSTGWDNGTFRIFYLLGAVVTVPWLALGTVYLLAGPKVGTRAQWGLVFFSGLAAGVV